MNQDVKFWEAVKKICERDNRFKPEAYAFIMESLEYTLQRFGEHRHVTATELLTGLFDLAKEKFGLLAHTVLTDWGLETAKDIGLAVYYLVDAEVLTKQAGDRFEDFDQEYDLKEILEEKYFE
ncbi:MAG: hypothetical protein JSW58_07010 [Candidatus Latescibacterota bacterium]|nr:MAG: hypothetical protein JSW58_07010 [Candidatus Latescibacterota bacterium]